MPQARSDWRAVLHEVGELQRRGHRELFGLLSLASSVSLKRLGRLRSHAGQRRRRCHALLCARRGADVHTLTACVQVKGDAVAVRLDALDFVLLALLAYAALWKVPRLLFLQWRRWRRWRSVTACA